MALFQKTIIRKYQNQLDQGKVTEAWNKFQAHFHNATIQENIRNSKEEQYQAGFLVDLFVKVLGYTINPSEGYNLSTEYKNEKDSKKADGALIFGDKVVAVIELKGTNTTDLGKIEAQAFGYKNNQKDCDYVITSNFEKLRFYVDNAINHLEFNLFKLNRDEFELLYLCLQKSQIQNGVPKKIQNESIVQEEDVTKKLYKDYSLFKRVLFTNLCELNPQRDQLEIFKKTQKLLDRFLFVFFAEDRGLIPPYSVRRIVREWDTLKDLDVYIPLLDRFRQFFGYFNSGYKGKDFEIFSYNGGLFAPDEFLDTIQIADELLYEHTVKLADYNFASEVDVNILGHIFENSLNEIDEIKAQIAGEVVEKTKTKRKKDGVFYTPKYITKYIVDNTVGKLCEEQKAELGIVEDEYFTDKKRTKPTIKKLSDKLTAYREWLLQLTICDPACGSGAFLNQALEFLIAEHRYIDELQAKLFGDAMVLTDIENSILENNLFGVDLNEESVEIAKLSLWLRTAQPNRKLNNLNNNIKCGNSLIDDPAVAGDKAFNWAQEFPTVFAKGGFDVIIGNPPYVQLQSMGDMSNDLANCGYESYHKGADIYCLFTEKGFKLLKHGGMESFIMPNKWMLVSYGKPLRKFLSNTGLRQVLNFGDIQFFEGAATIVCIFITQKSEKYDKVKVLSINSKNFNGDFKLEVESNIYEYPSIKFGENEWIIQPYKDAIKLDKMTKNGVELNKLSVTIYRGILTGYNEAFYINDKTKLKLIADDPNSIEIIKPMVRGRDITAYGITDFEYLIGTFPSLKLDIDNYPAVKEHLLSFGYDRLKQTGGAGSRKKTKGKWFETQDSIGYYQEFSKPKIIYPNMTSIFPFMYDDSGMLGNQKCFILTAKDDSVSLLYLTALFNSSLSKLWLWYNCPELLGGTREISKVYFEKFPVPKADQNQTSEMENHAKRQINATTNLQTVSSKFLSLVQSELRLQEISKAMQKWYELSFADFAKELKKKKIELSLAQKSEWMDFFEAEKKKALELQQQINQTDKEIDRMVYELYELTEEEIKIVEGDSV